MTACVHQRCALQLGRASRLCSYLQSHKSRRPKLAPCAMQQDLDEYTPRVSGLTGRQLARRARLEQSLRCCDSITDLEFGDAVFNPMNDTSALETERGLFLLFGGAQGQRYILKEEFSMQIL
ncbi:hypothetical protein CRV24_005395 [Beauveria bassiana]|nr:hypothetical protein CRV24_005395 [Beauveria bassiana]KAH8709657.1 hypothetical protein HC256_009569 [Beauveria bassiana]